MRPTSSLVAIGAFVSVVCFVIFRGAWSVTKYVLFQFLFAECERERSEEMSD